MMTRGVTILYDDDDRGDLGIAEADAGVKSRNFRADFVVGGHIYQVPIVPSDFISS